jgi:hypothetical protein
VLFPAARCDGITPLRTPPLLGSVGQPNFDGAPENAEVDEAERGDDPPFAGYRHLVAGRIDSIKASRSLL